MKKKLGTLALVLTFAAGSFLSACGGTSGPSPSAAGNNPGGQTGSATVTLNVPQTASKGARTIAILTHTKYFSVVVTLPGSPTTVTSGAANLVNGIGTVTVNNIPTGSARKFTVTAYDAAGTGAHCLDSTGTIAVGSCAPPAGNHVISTGFTSEDIVAGPNVITVALDGMPASISPASPTAFYGNGTPVTIPFTALDQDGNTLLTTTYVPSPLGSGLKVDITVGTGLNAGKIITATPTSGNTGGNYNIGDLVTVNGGTTSCPLYVKTLQATGFGVATLVSGSAAGTTITNCGTGYVSSLGVATTFGTSALATSPLLWSITAGTASVANAGTIDPVVGLYTPPTTGTAGQNFHVNVANNLGIASASAIAAPSTLVTLMANTGTTGAGTTLNALPPIPTGLAGTGGTGNAILSWTQAGTASSWTVYWDVTAAGASPGHTNSFVCGGGSPCTVTVPNDQTNFFVVAATNLNGTSSDSTIFGPITSVTAPSAVSVAPHNATSATLTWTKDVNATSSNIYFKTTSPAFPTGNRILGATSAVAGNVTPLTANTAYYVAATSAIAGAVPPVGNSESSSTEVIYVPAPGGTTVTAAPGSAIYHWTAVTGATSYNVYWTNDGTLPAEIAGVAQGTSTKITGATSGGSVLDLAGGVTFKFIVTANLGGTESLPSTVASGVVTALGIPATPTAIKGTAASTGVVTWSLETGATSYNIYCDVSTGPASAIKTAAIIAGTDLLGAPPASHNTATIATPNISGLTTGLTYFCVVGGVSGALEGPLSGISTPGFVSN